jgi:predicted RND superfamily exporter protein
VVEREIARELPPDLERICLASIALVAALLAVYYRRGRAFLLVVAPLLAAWIAFFALAPALTVWNALALPFAIGYGLDDHVFLVGRALEGVGRGVGETMRLAGRAVVATSLATLAGFASLGLTSFAGVRSLGVSGALAVAVCLASALIVLPALLGCVSRQTRGAKLDGVY